LRRLGQRHARWGSHAIAREMDGAKRAVGQVLKQTFVKPDGIGVRGMERG